jgi:hypothetical protein
VVPQGFSDMIKEIGETVIKELNISLVASEF